MDESGETNSTFTGTESTTSASTMPGLGYLSGKAIRVVGTAVVNGVDAIFRRRGLPQQHHEVTPDRRADSRASSDHYNDSLEDISRTGTYTSSSTIPGLGYLSGTVIKGVGTVVTNQVDNILIRQRLAQLEAILGQNSCAITTDSRDRESLYNDLLELSRPVYNSSIRTRAFRLIMGRVGGMDFEDLAAAVLKWPIDESYDLLDAMVSCIQVSSSDPITPKSMYYSAGQDAYRTQLRYASWSSEEMRFTAFLLYVGLTISLSSSPAFSRLVLRVNIPYIIGKLLALRDEWSKYLLPGQFVLHALIKNLDPVEDSTSIYHLRRILNSNPTLGPIPASFFLSAPSSKEESSYISQLRDMFQETELIHKEPPLFPGTQKKIAFAWGIKSAKQRHRDKRWVIDPTIDAFLTSASEVHQDTVQTKRIIWPSLSAKRLWKISPLNTKTLHTAVHRRSTLSHRKNALIPLPFFPPPPKQKILKSSETTVAENQAEVRNREITSLMEQLNMQHKGSYRVPELRARIDQMIQESEILMEPLPVYQLPPAYELEDR
ncbi:hypothetical protein BDP27DRAFT_1352099, partial [Rhodocollybia butyracea]